MQARSTKTPSVQDLLEQYDQRLDVTFPTSPHAAYERRLIFDHVVEPPASTLRQRYEAIASALRDLLAQRWLLTGRSYDEHEPEIRYALDMIRDNAFSHAEHGVFTPIWDALLTHGNHYMHLADLSAYARAQEKVGELYRQLDAWARKAILNVAHSGKFSSDRTIAEYAADIRRVKPCPVS